MFGRKKDNYRITWKTVASYKGLPERCYNTIIDYKTYAFPQNNLKIVC